MIARFIRPLVVTLLTIASLACASLGTPYQALPSVPEGKALVYVYRPKSFVGSAISYTVHAGDAPVVKLVNGGYRTYVAEPGETEFWAKTEARTSVTERLEAGKTYYLRGGVGVGLVAGRPKLSFVPAEQGQTEIASCRTVPERTPESGVSAGQ